MKMSDQDVIISNLEGVNVLRINLPQLELLSYEPVFEDASAPIEKGTILKTLFDRVTNKHNYQAAEKQIKSAALQFVDKYDAAPTKTEVIKRLSSLINKFTSLKYLESMGILRIEFN
jgi:hypothetical protein